MLSFYGIVEFYDSAQQIHYRKVGETSRFVSFKDFVATTSGNQLTSSLLIPINIPTAFDSGHTFALIKSINYFTEIHISTKNEIVTDRKQLYMEHAKSFSSTNQNIFNSSIKVNNLSYPNGKIVATLKIPSQNVRFGQVFACSIAILNCFRKIKGELRLVEKILRIDDRPPKSHTFTKIIIISKRIASLKVEDKMWMRDLVDMWIPDEPWRYKLPGTISLGVYLQLKLNVFMCPNVLVECPLFIHSMSEKRKDECFLQEKMFLLNKETSYHEIS
ncbi:unnamed protein product [Auanema sp. JU1783]|nr:unnamed protein product [Auanema sp. JU1783]